MRAGKTWIAAGRTMQDDDLPALLLGMAEAVASGELEPARASAIAQLVKTSLTVTAHISWGRRLTGLETFVTKLEDAQATVARPDTGRRRHQ